MREEPCRRCFGPYVTNPGRALMLGKHYSTYLCLECDHAWYQHAAPSDEWHEFRLAEMQYLAAIYVGKPTQAISRRFMAAEHALYAFAQAFVESGEEARRVSLVVEGIGGEAINTVRGAIEDCAVPVDRVVRLAIIAAGELAWDERRLLVQAAREALARHGDDTKEVPT